MSNLKQMGLASMQYVQDYDEKYAPAIGWQTPLPGPAEGGNWFGAWHWAQLLLPYHKSVQIFNCPSGASAYYQIPYQGNYGANKLIMPLDPRVASQPVVSMSSINSPASIYLMMDSGGYYFDASYSLTPFGDFYYTPGVGNAIGMNPSSNCTVAGPLAPGMVSDCQNGRHFDGVNVAFADGHVKWLKSAKLTEEARKPGNGAWNPAND